MYFAAKLLGRYQCADKPTTAIVLHCASTRRMPGISSMITSVAPGRPKRLTARSRGQRTKRASRALSPRGRLVVRVVVADTPARRDAIRQPRQRGIVAGSEGAAIAHEIGIGAEHPVAALHAHRRRAIVEARALQVGHQVAVHRVRAALEILSFVEHDARVAAPTAATAAANAGLGHRARRAHATGDASEVRPLSGPQ